MNETLWKDEDKIKMLKKTIRSGPFLPRCYNYEKMLIDGVSNYILINI